MSQKLFIVSVSFEYAVMAESAADAERSSTIAEYELRLGDVALYARPAIRNGKASKPSGWSDDSGVYTGPRSTHDTITWGDAVAKDGQST